MAFTVSTNSLTLDTLTLTGPVAGAKKYVWFISYVKGDETNAKLSVSFIKGGVTYVSSPLDTAAVAQQVFTITGAKSVAIPVTVPAGVTSIVGVLSNTGGTPTGTLVVDGYPDLPYA